MKELILFEKDLIALVKNIKFKKSNKPRLEKATARYQNYQWRCGVVVTSAELRLAKPELKFCTGSNLACSASTVCDGENL